MRGTLSLVEMGQFCLEAERGRTHGGRKTLPGALFRYAKSRLPLSAEDGIGVNRGMMRSMVLLFCIGVRKRLFSYRKLWSRSHGVFERRTKKNRRKGGICYEN